MNTLNHLNNKIEKLKDNLLSELEKVKYSYNANMDNLDWAYLSMGYPKLEPVHNLFNPMYISTLNDFKFVWDADFILCRDGMMPLVNFFQFYKRAPGIETILLIHKDLAFVVPKAWQNNIVLYRIEEHNTVKSLDELDQILFFQFANDAESSQEKLMQDISRLREMLNNDLTKVKVHSYLRGNPYYEPSAEVVHESYHMIRILLKEFGIDTEFQRWTDVKRIRNYQSTGFYSADHGVFTNAFSYIDDFLLRKGAISIDGRFTAVEKRSDEKKYNISPGHSLILSNFQTSDNDFWKEFAKFSNYCKYSTSIYNSDMFLFLRDYAKEKSIVV